MVKNEEERSSRGGYSVNGTGDPGICVILHPRCGCDTVEGYPEVITMTAVAMILTQSGPD